MLHPLQLTKFHANNYKAFDASFECQLAPLTLVFGRNGTGKSALVRLPYALAGALSGSGSPGLPLHLRDELVLGRSLASFVHGGSADKYGVGVTLENDEHRLTLDVVVRRDPRTPIRMPGQWIDRWSLHDNSTELGSFTWNLGDNRYDIQGPAAGLRPVGFVGLLPTLPDGSLHPLAVHLRPTPRVLHIGAVREPFGEDITAYHPSIPLEVGTFGGATRRVLGALRYHPRTEILQRVITFARHCFDVDLRVVEVGEGAFLGTSIEARPIRRSTWLPIRELGTGLAHGLPLLVQLAIAAHPSEDNPAPSVLICEEPEAHTHPRVQTALADVVIDSVLSGGYRALIETHSETFVLRVRRRVAEGLLSPEQVAMYWVDDDEDTTQVRRLHLDNLGYVEGWPEGWFDTAVLEVNAIGRAMKSHED